MSRPWLLLASVILSSLHTLAQLAEPTTTSLAPWPGSGVMVSGELWDSFLPPNAGPSYIERTAPLYATFLRIGNFDRTWSTPTHMWPGGWPYGMFWSKGMYLTEFNPDSTWNPPAIAGSANPSRHPKAGPNYAHGAYAPSLLGGGDPLRNYTRETRWVDPASRRHAIYEAGWPTNIGIDVRVTIHQFSLNWLNFDDAITVEITLTNTGVLDMNADGIPDSLQTGRPGRNRIRALTMTAHGEMFCMYTLSRGAGRGSRLTATPAFGYVGDADRTGQPRDIMVAFPGESVPWLKDMGINEGTNKYYTEVWSSWGWLAAKRGAAAPGMIHTLPDKLTIYGTHGIGLGSERGFYATAGQARGLLGMVGWQTDPARLHTLSMGTWYKDGGRTRDSLLLDLSPDPDFFASGRTGDPTSFVPATAPQRPKGDRKLTQQFEINTHEPGWKKGFSARNSFDGDIFSGIGPFSLDPGESMTIVWSEAGGYRFDGVVNAMAASRWGFEHGYALPEQPPLPTIRVENTVDRSIRVRWDNRADSHPGFESYRIYRAASSSPVEWITGGMRGLDRYWETPTPGPIPDSLLRPVNPLFSAYDVVAGKSGPADSWGPYQLVAVIPRSALPAYSSPGSAGFTYAWEDHAIDPGFAYWYTVAASASTNVDLGPDYGGIGSATASRLESSNLNRNGATGLWQGIYPFADLHSLFPTTLDGRRAIGAGFVFSSGTSTPDQLAGGGVRVGVRPNPYKKWTSWDNRASSTDHRLMFVNLPPRATITILDVSGQVIDVLRFVSSDGETGSMFWDCFSKDGNEVASGLYLFVVEFDGGKQVGYFSILR